MPPFEPALTAFRLQQLQPNYYPKLACHSACACIASMIFIVFLIIIFPLSSFIHHLYKPIVVLAASLVFSNISAHRNGKLRRLY